MGLSGNQVLQLLLQQVTNPISAGPLQGLLDSMGAALHVLYIFIVRLYFIFIVLGFIVYATTLHDSMAKVLVSFGIIAFFVGPVFASLATGSPMAAAILADGDVMLMDLIGMNDGDLMFLLLAFADLVGAICILGGAIMRFTQPSSEMTERGTSLIVRGIILLCVCVFMYTQPFL
ncbi:MAG: hypothetical protein K9W43_00690 [Candidatus Thorarchaeota archaeon]|nr:hypothetical protein [Candidatus Thorarchaeota archaeon]